MALAMALREAADFAGFFLQQVCIVFFKNVRQKCVAGRESIKSAVLIPWVAVAFTCLVCILLQSSPLYDNSNYSLTQLPPLSQNGGIFDSSQKQFIFARHLYYSPNNHSGVVNLMKNLAQQYPDVNATGFLTQTDLANAFILNSFDIWCAVTFSLTSAQMESDSFGNAGNFTNVAYSIRMNPGIASLPLGLYNPNVYNDYVTAADGWLRTGYFTLQYFIRTQISNAIYSESSFPLKIQPYFQRYPASPVYQNAIHFDSQAVAYFFWKWLIPPVWTASIMLPMLSFLNEIVREKETGMRDLLEISGMMPLAYWIGYVLTIFSCLLVTIWVIVGFAYGSSFISPLHVPHYASLSYVLVLSLTGAGMVFGFLVHKSEYYGLPMFILTLAAALGGLFIAQNGSFNPSTKLAFAFFLPPSGFTIGIFIIEDWFFSNPNTPLDVNYGFGGNRNLPSLSDLEGTMIGSAIVYTLIAYCMPFDWLFCWQVVKVDNATSYDSSAFYPCVSQDDEGRRHAADPVLLDVQNLSHMYPDGTHAVKNISLQVRSGEILSFLGANGAGKSTTMHMLCGTLKASTGDAIVDKFSITNATTKARRSLGICTQQNIIWSDLTVAEHLLIFGFLRNTPLNSLWLKVKLMLDDLGFPEKSSFLAAQLSGGQKRRLCVGISMIGNNKVVYLDEPTAGCDPVARRQLWELVEKNRFGRAILLTTHFMDEADVLGDRIAIIKDGRLRCIGTASYLKRTFGIGYLLRCSLAPAADHRACFQEVSRIIDHATLVSQAGNELCIRISKDDVHLFPVLFEHLESHGRDRGFASFGIETTTLDDVFMRIANEDAEEVHVKPVKSDRQLEIAPDRRVDDEASFEQRDIERCVTNNDIIELALSKGAPAKSQFLCDINLSTQVRILFLKRFRQFTRSKGQFFMGIFVPLISIVIICIILKAMPAELVIPPPSPQQLVYVPPTSITPILIAAPTQATYSLYTTQLSAAIKTSAANSTPISVNPTFAFVGQNYSILYSFVNSVALEQPSNHQTVNSSEAIAYGRSNSNYTLLYNASYPINFAGVNTALLDAAVSSFSSGFLSFTEYCQYLPSTTFGGQVTYAYFTALFFGVYTGAFGSALSIVISGERVGGVKHQQLASGASATAYWLSNLFWDILVINLLGIFLAIALAITSPKAWGGTGWAVVFIAGLCYSFPACLRFYCISYWVSDVKIAQTLYFYVSVAFMYVVLTIWGLTLFTGSQGPAVLATQFATAISAICTIIEPAFGYFLLIVYQNNFFGVLTFNHQGNALGIAVGGSVLIAQFVQFLIYSAMLCYLETGSFAVVRSCICRLFCFPCFAVMCCARSLKDLVIPATASNGDQDHLVDITPEFVGEVAIGDEIVSENIRNRGQIDRDVLVEEQRVDAIFKSRKLDHRLHSIFIHKLCKVYFARGTVPTKVAVKRLSLVIQHGEIFGLLGANGAGKTTVLKMVSGLETPTQGIALIDGFNIISQRTLAQRSMGLCPQFDTLVDRLTVRENLFLFARLKGIPTHSITGAVEAMMMSLNIKQYENKLGLQLSGGNRRKVSLIVALIGQPATAYLDEPSTGLDPLACRLMWRLLKQVAERKQQALVLTTHNMLECEAICTRIGIMKTGELKCIGNSQHLRSTFGTGFLLEIVVEGPEYLSAVKEFVSSNFSNASFVDEHANLINCEFPRESIALLSVAFHILENNKIDLHITDYSLSQSTLEQVFLKQIRPRENDIIVSEEEVEDSFTRPHAGDYVAYYLALVVALLFPGTHHFVLRNNWRGMLYLITLNELYCGWLLDLFDARVLVQRSVQEFGHIRIFNCCLCYYLCYPLWYYTCCCWTCCCCCFRSCCPAPCGTSNKPTAGKRSDGVQLQSVLLPHNNSPDNRDFP